MHLKARVLCLCHFHCVVKSLFSLSDKVLVFTLFDKTRTYFEILAKTGSYVKV